MSAKLTHVALHVTDIERTIAFYTDVLGMRLAHRRRDPQTQQATAWLTNAKAGEQVEFIIVLLAGDPAVFGFAGAEPQSPMGPITHFGFDVESREEVEQFAEVGRRLGILKVPPTFVNEAIGYICFLTDPDGHTIEISYGQDLQLD